MACPISSSLAGSPTILVMGARELRRECAGGRNCARVDSPHPLRARLELCPARAGDRYLGLYHRIKVVVGLRGIVASPENFRRNRQTETLLSGLFASSARTNRETAFTWCAETLNREQTVDVTKDEPANHNPERPARATAIRGKSRTWTHHSTQATRESGTTVRAPR